MNLLANRAGPVQKDDETDPVRPHSYFGLALLYRVTGHPEESLKVLERLFILMPKTPGIESTQIYTEARNLYWKLRQRRNQRQALIKTRNSGEREYCRVKKRNRTYVPKPGDLQPASFQMFDKNQDLTAIL